jgi:RNA recognition motif-containing protein
MQIRRREHGNVPGVVISTLSCIGKFVSRLPGKRLLKQERRSVDGTALRSNREEGPMSSKLFLINIPYNCSERELQDWVESRGIQTRSIRIVRDLVAGVSPAFGYVELKDASTVLEAIVVLNGKRMRNQIVTVKEAQTAAAHQGRRTA